MSDAEKSLVKSEIEALLNYDPGTGEFVWLQKRRGGASPGQRAGCTKAGGYVTIRVLGRSVYAHRLAWFLTHGRWPNGVIDHIDGDPSHNRISNLRDVPQGINLQNQRRAHKSNRSSRLLGVTFDSRNGKWMAKISIANKTRNLGRFASAEAAHIAYRAAKRMLHEGCAA